jgi:hypothetical protein
VRHDFEKLGGVPWNGGMKEESRAKVEYSKVLHTLRVKTPTWLETGQCMEKGLSRVRT